MNEVKCPGAECGGTGIGEFLCTSGGCLCAKCAYRSIEVRDGKAAADEWQKRWAPFYRSGPQAATAMAQLTPADPKAAASLRAQQEKHRALRSAPKPAKVTADHVHYVEHPDGRREEVPRAQFLQLIGAVEAKPCACSQPTKLAAPKPKTTAAEYAALGAKARAAVREMHAREQAAIERHPSFALAVRQHTAAGRSDLEARKLATDTVRRLTARKPTPPKGNPPPRSAA